MAGVRLPGPHAPAPRVRHERPRPGLPDHPRLDRARLLRLADGPRPDAHRRRVRFAAVVFAPVVLRGAPLATRTRSPGSCRSCGELRILRQWAGICDISVDFSPIMSATGVDGFYVTTGWGTWGFKAIPAGGEGMAELIATGRPLTVHRAVHARSVPAGPRPRRRRLGRDPLMLWLDCPRCGRRPLDEFVFGGERRTVAGPPDRPGRARLRRGLDLREPRRAHDRALVPRVRLPPLADGHARHEHRCRARGALTDDDPGRPAIRDDPAQPRAGRGGRGRAAARAGRRSRRIPGVHRERPGRRGGRGGGARARRALDGRRRLDGLRGGGAEPGGRDLRAGRDGPARRSAWMARSSSPSVAARRWTRPRRSTWRATNERPVWDLEYDGDDLRPGRPIVAVPTTAGTGAEAHPFGVITRTSDRPQGLHRPPLPPAGGDHPRSGTDRRHAALGDRRDRGGCDDPLDGVAALAQPEPVRRGDGPARHPDGPPMAAARVPRRHRPRSARADARRLAPRGGGAGERHRRGPGPCPRPRDRDARAPGPRPRPRGRGAGGARLLRRRTGTARPRTAPRRRGHRRRLDRRIRRDRRPAPRSAPCARSSDRWASGPGCAASGFDDALLDVVAQDAVDDAAIGNSPRLPTFDEARAILAAAV